MINIRLEDRWDYAGNTLNIIPIIGANLKNVKKKAFKSDELVVKKPTKKEEGKVNPATKTGNKPTIVGDIVGDIVTDVADFKPCFYSQIKSVVTRNTKKSKTL